MKLWDILKNVGNSVIRNVVPGGGLVVDVVNELLPDGKKLPSDATGDDISKAVESLPPEQRASLLEKELDVDITQIQEAGSTVRAMLESDVKNPQSTRPYIAKHSFHVLAFVVVLASSIFAVGVINKDSTMVEAIMDGWPFILAILAPLIVLLRSYFGVLDSEHKTKLSAAGGKVPQTGLAGIISSLVKR